LPQAPIEGPKQAKKDNEEKLQTAAKKRAATENLEQHADMRKKGVTEAQKEKAPPRPTEPMNQGNAAEWLAYCKWLTMRTRQEEKREKEERDHERWGREQKAPAPARKAVAQTHRIPAARRRANFTRNKARPVAAAVSDHETAQPVANTKFATWNLNGLRSALKKRTLETFLRKERPDVVNLTELKITAQKLKRHRAKLDQMLGALGYKYICFHTCDTPLTGYSGTAVLAKAQPVREVRGWMHDDPDAEGRVLTVFFEQCVLVTSYTPCSGLDAQFEEKRRTFDKSMQAHLREVHASKRPEQEVLWCGDLNAAIHGKDVFDGVTNPSRQEWPGFRPWERQTLAGLLEEFGLADSFETLHPEATGRDRFTYYMREQLRQRGKGWRLDYFMASERMLDPSHNGPLKILNVRTGWEHGGSDHVPLICDMHDRTAPPARAEEAEPPPSEAALDTEASVFEQLCAAAEAVMAEAPAFHDEHGRDPDMGDAEQSLEIEAAAAAVAETPACLDGRVTDLDRGGPDHRRVGPPSGEPSPTSEAKAAAGNCSDASPACTLATAARRDEYIVAQPVRTVPITSIGLNNKERIEALWDSGSSYTIISRAAAQQTLGAGYSDSLQTPNTMPAFTLANGSIAKPDGCIRLNIAPTNKADSMEHTLWVVQTTPVPVILGSDFCKRAGAILNFSDNTIQLRKFPGSGARHFQLRQAMVAERPELCELRAPTGRTVPITEVNLDGKRFEALWDSGSSYTIISQAAAQAALGEAYQRQLSKPNGMPRFKLADGSVTEPDGCVRLDIAPTSATACTKHTFWVVPSTPVQVILGVDFFTRSKAVINFAENAIWLRQFPKAAPVRFQLEAVTDADGEVCELLTAEDVVIPAHTVHHTLRLQPTLHYEGLNGIVTPHGLGTQCSSRLSSHISPMSSGFVCAGLCNQTDQPVLIRRGTTVGIFTPAHVDTEWRDEYNGLERYDLHQNPFGTHRNSPPQVVAAAASAEPTGELGLPGRTRLADLSRLGPSMTQQRVAAVEAILRFTERSSTPRLARPAAEPGVSTRTGPADIAAPAYLETPHEEAPPSDGLPPGLAADAMHHLTEEQQAKLKAMLRSCIGTFVRRPDGPQVAQGVEMKIELEPGAKPVSAPVRPLNPACRAIVIDHVQSMLRTNLIEPAVSPWNSPVVLAKKKDGTFRFCLDFRAVNDRTRKYSSTLGRTQDVLDSLGGCDWYSCVDAEAAYMQINLEQESRDITAFATPIGLMRWTRAAFGLRNSQEYWIRLVNQALEGINFQYVLAFVDDLCVYTKGTFEKHVEHLREVFTRLERCGIVLKAKKCLFAVQAFSFLGHVVSKEGVRKDPKAREAFIKLAQPSSLKELQSFLSSCSYWRRFTPRFASIVDPLRPLLKKDGFRTPWTAEQTAAFEELKREVASDRVCHHPRWDLPFQIHTDGSKKGLGAMLAQDVDGILIPIQFASRALTDAELNYAANEIEMLAAVWAFQLWRSYVIAQGKTTLVTDHKALVQLLDSNTKSSGGRTLRWQIRLSEYSIEVVHRDGALHVVPDTCSRLVHPGTGKDGVEVEALSLIATNVGTRRVTRAATRIAEHLAKQADAPERKTNPGKSKDSGQAGNGSSNPAGKADPGGAGARRADPARGEEGDVISVKGATFRIEPEPPDGHCMYHVVARYLRRQSDTPDMATRLSTIQTMRQRVQQRLLEHPNKYLELAQTAGYSSTEAKAVAVLSPDGRKEYGDEADACAMSEEYNIDFIAVSLPQIGHQEEQPTVTRASGLFALHGKTFSQALIRRPVFALHHQALTEDGKGGPQQPVPASNRNHYVTLVPLDMTTPKYVEWYKDDTSVAAEAEKGAFEFYTDAPGEGAGQAGPAGAPEEEPTEDAIQDQQVRCHADTIQKIAPGADIQALVKTAQAADKDMRRRLASAEEAQQQGCTCASAPAEHAETCALGKRSDFARDGILFNRARSTRAGLATYRERLWVPETLTEPIMFLFHGASAVNHCDANRTIQAVGERFHWTGMAEQIRRWCRACLQCKKRKTPRPANNGGKAGNLLTGRPGTVYMDITGPYPLSRDGNQYLLTMVDTFLRWPECIPLPSTHAEVIARAVRETWIARYGCPDHLVADNASYFTGPVLQNLTDMLGIRKSHSLPYHPTDMSPVERFHRTLGSALTILTSRMKDTWDENIWIFLLSYRTSVNASTGYSPFEATFGRSPKLPMDASLNINMAQSTEQEFATSTRAALREVWSEMRKSQAAMAERNAAYRSDKLKEVAFKPGQWVLVWDPKAAEKLPKTIALKQKLMDNYTGPYEVRSTHGEGGAQIKIYNTDRKKAEVVHANRCVQFHPYVGSLPSIATRPRISKAERTVMNQTRRATEEKLKEPEEGDLVVFPREMDDGSPGFGCAEVTQVHDETVVGQWLGNLSDTLLGRYFRCWMDPDQGRFYFGHREAEHHTPFTTEDTDGFEVLKSEIADVGFKLTPDQRIPRLTLERMQAHPDFEWKLLL